MPKAANFNPYPASDWDGQARDWDDVVANPRNPHQFYYYEADLCISRFLDKSMRVLELGCGTGGSTRAHAPQVARLVAVDSSREMVRHAAGKILRKRNGRDVHSQYPTPSTCPFGTPRSMP